MIDCLIIGFNDSSFADQVAMLRSMGPNSGAYRDLRLAFFEHQKQPYRALDILTRFAPPGTRPPNKPFHWTDFLWPTITYLGTYLTHRGFTFDYVNSFHLEQDRLREKLTRGQARTIAITTTLYVTPHPVLEIISFIRRYNDEVRIIVGGPFIANQTRLAKPAAVQRLFQYLGADFYVISQEGEAALVNLLRTLRDGGDFDRIENIGYRKGDSYVITPSVVERSSLEENMVDYRLFPKEDLGEFVSLRTAKSCPFACAFCGFPQRAGKYTYLSTALVERELDNLKALGTVTTLTFLDDTFNVPRERFKEILRMMIKNDYGFKWNSYYRCDHGDEETIRLMGEAGCEGVFMGVESGSDTILQRMNKTARRRDYLKAIPLLRKAGVSTHANLIIGFPGETEETVRETVQLLEEAAPDFFLAQLWYCDPVTPVWNKREEYGIEGSGFSWSHATMNYETACAIVDDLFFSIKNSVWLPQYNFGQWSTFYLQRKGMTLEQIKTFVRRFNAVVGAGLRSPGKEEANPELLADLRDSCRFNGEGPRDTDSAAGTIGELVDWLRGQNVTVWLQDDRVHCRGPEEAMTPALRARLAERKEELLVYLA
jgi:anaerobic magnesium-protoporphyrin IX monomethyl ester cyclase